MCWLPLHEVDLPYVKQVPLQLWAKGNSSPYVRDPLTYGNDRRRRPLPSFLLTLFQRVKYGRPAELDRTEVSSTILQSRYEMKTS